MSGIKPTFMSSRLEDIDDENPLENILYRDNTKIPKKIQDKPGKTKKHSKGIDANYQNNQLEEVFTPDTEKEGTRVRKRNHSSTIDYGR
jgi:hypothetical protein